MTAVTIVAPILAMSLVAGLVVHRWTTRLWLSLVVGVFLILVLNLAIVFQLQAGG